MATDEVKWIKIALDMFGNRKIKQIRKMPEGDALIAIWIQLLCMAGQSNSSGLVLFAPDMPFTDEMLATEFDRPILTVRMALKVFQSFQMIEDMDGVIAIRNWEKYQCEDGLAKVREKGKKRQKEFRERQRAQALAASSEVPALPPPPEPPQLKPQGRKPDAPKEQIKSATQVLEDWCLPPAVTECLHRWFQYKKERREPYKPMGLTALLNRVEQNVALHSESAVISIIEQSMSSNYKGILWDKLGKGEASGHQTGAGTNQNTIVGECKRVSGVEYV